jgi:toxin ParE1/3/4
MSKEYSIKLSKTAFKDLDQIAEYYEEQQTGLGCRFLEYFIVSREKLKDFPNAYRSGLKPNTREMVLSDFPFIIVYRVTGLKIIIVTVYHQSKQIP